MIKAKNKDEIEIMRQGGEILASVLLSVAKEVRPGVTTEYLNDMAESLIYQHGALPAFKGYDGYPAALCTSVNEQIVHGLPSGQKLNEGDIVGLDLGVIWPPENCTHCAMNHGCSSQPGMFTDAAITVPVGEISPAAKKIIKSAKEALRVAIEKIKPGSKLSEVSSAIEKSAKNEGFEVIRDLVGHGVGYKLHEDPEIPNFHASWMKDIILKEGMTLALEPMISAGSYKIKKSKDKYAYETVDGSLSAHFEHTVVVTKDGCGILTKI
jgi:methionyl aminopeptidase